jgi:hypothetical protein
MATYSSSQAFVSTTRYTRTAGGAVGTSAEQTLYTVPAQREAEVEIQYLNWGSADPTTNFKIDFSGGGSTPLVIAATAGNYPGAVGVVGGTVTTPSTNLNQSQPGLPANFPMKFKLVAGETVKFQPVSSLATYQYNFVVKEFVA